MRDTASDTGAFDAGIFDAEAIAADAVALAELPGGTGHEQVRIDWLQRRLAGKPGSRHVDGAGNLVWRSALRRTGSLSSFTSMTSSARRRCGASRGATAGCAARGSETTRSPPGPARPSSGARPTRPRSTGRKPRWPTYTSPPACGSRRSGSTAGRPARCRSPTPFVAAVLRARRSVGLPDTTGDGSTDANAALAAGIPAVALGCCAGEDMHAPTERIRADSIATGARQLRAVFREILD
jgi:hypothetical protein